MSSVLPKPFELQGEFTGFIRTVQGKRRMVVRTAHGEECMVKVPKELRHHLTSTLTPGCRIAVIGEEELEPGEQVPKRVASSVRLLTDSGAAVALHCPIRVCNKKNCWRSGGKQLWQALEERIAAHALTGSVTLEAVDCLDQCKRAPVAEWEGRQFVRCSPEDAAGIVEMILATEQNS